MKNETHHITRMGMFLALTAIAALCLPPQVRAGGGSFYATVTNVTQLIADINYADTNGGTFTINLQPNTTFSLTSTNNTTDYGNGLPVIGGANAVNLTITGNGDTIQNSVSTNGKSSSQFRIFEVAAGASLAMDDVTLQGGYSISAGGAVYNKGTLAITRSTISGNIAWNGVNGFGGAIYNTGTATVSDGSTIYGNEGIYGGAIENEGMLTVQGSTVSGNYADSAGAGIRNVGGTVAISNAVVSDNFVDEGDGGAIYNAGGTVTISNGSTLTGNSADKNEYSDIGGLGGGIYNTYGAVTISDSTMSGNVCFGNGGGIYNDSGGTVTVENSSSIIGNGLNTEDDSGDLFPDDIVNIGVLYQDSTSTVGSLGGYSAIGLNPIVSIASWSSTAHQIVLSWSTNYPGFTLQSSTGLGSTNWTDCASPTVSGASYVVTNSMSAAAQFFRLKR